MKIVINTCYGGYALSKAAYKELGIPWDTFGFAFNDTNQRSDPRLVACVEKLGQYASQDGGSNLKVVDVPDGVEWTLEEYG